MLEVGKKYRIKGTNIEFWLRKDNSINCTPEQTGIMRIAKALATDNYEEVKKKVKKTFYQGIQKRGNYFITTNWSLNKEDINSYTWEIIEREFEVEVE